MHTNYESLTVVTPAEPILVPADLANHTSQNTTILDDDVADWIEAATLQFTAESGYEFGVTEYQLALDDWPCRIPFTELRYIALPRGPVLDGEDSPVVTYRDVSGSWQTLAGTSLDERTGRVFLPSSLPSLYASALPRVMVAFSAGIETPDKRAVQAVKMLVTHWIQQRAAFGTDSLKQVPMSWTSLVNAMRVK